MPSWTPSVPPKNSCAGTPAPRRGTRRVERLPDGTYLQAFSTGLRAVGRGACRARAARVAAEATCISPRARSGGRGSRPRRPPSAASATAPRTISGTGTRVRAARLAGVDGVADRAARRFAAAAAAAEPPEPLRRSRRCRPSRCRRAARPLRRRRSWSSSVPPSVPWVIRFWSACLMSSRALEYVSTSVGQVLERLAVAVDRVDAVDPAVVPVVDQRLPAGRRCPSPRRAPTPAASDERRPAPQAGAL